MTEQKSEAIVDQFKNDELKHVQLRACYVTPQLIEHGAIASLTQIIDLIEIIPPGGRPKPHTSRHF